MPITKGQILERRNGGKQKVLEVLGDLYFLSGVDDFENANGCWTIQEIEGYFIIPVEKFCPKRNESYWTIFNLSGICVSESSWNDTEYDQARLAQGLVFQTEALAQAKLEEILEVLRK